MLAPVAAALLPLAVMATTIPVGNQMVQQDGLIRYPVTAVLDGPLVGSVSKRQTQVDSFSSRSGMQYIINLVLGTPGQSVPVIFDTGSDELWVNPVCSKSNSPSFCSAQPRFTMSTTIHNQGATGSITYGTGYVDFTYVDDFVKIGSAKVSQQTFGVAYDSAFATLGILGAGPNLFGWDSPYPYFIDNLVSQGFINSRAFSMDLRGFESDRGAIIYGGVDTKKYTGSLAKLPIVPDSESPDGYTRLYVWLAGISVNQADGTVVNVYSKSAASKGQVVLLDSGYSVSALPKYIFDKLLAAFPSATPVANSNLYYVDCLDKGQGGSVDFSFAGKVINVPYYDFIWHYPESNFCLLGAYESDFAVLGDTFLRAAYVVYDWDNQKIHLAQTADCGTNLVAIGSGSNAVPSLAGCGGASSTSSSASSTATSSSSSISSSTSSFVTSTTSSSSSSSTVASSSTASSTATSSESSTSTGSSSTSTASSTESSTTSSTESSTASSTESSTASSTESSTASSTTSSSESSTVSSTDSSSSPEITSPPAVISKSTITFTTETTYTITSCPPDKASVCPLGKVTTKVITATETVCPQTTATYTVHERWTSGTVTGTIDHVLTVKPVVPAATPIVVPGCTPGAPLPAGVTLRPAAAIPQGGSSAPPAAATGLVAPYAPPKAAAATTLITAAPYYPTTAVVQSKPWAANGTAAVITSSTTVAAATGTAKVATAGASRLFGVSASVVILAGVLAVAIGL
ncbi:aspartic peptidase domain-containing protein [Podospora didyma]|uniref:Aspartic peptidase domain-containing protein n=1 Tax=Podospora didyma TaxID=330526 RepID=A0AAE0K9W8_9PEZI|nr:aspartic peptidase domain-containing protein [Podospora didyma]